MARPVVKFASPSQQQVQELEQIHASHRLPSLRRRAKAILLSSRGYSAAKIANILQASPNTVRRWIGHFQGNGVDGIRDEQRQGAKRSLSQAEQDILRELIERIRTRREPFWAN